MSQPTKVRLSSRVRKDQGIPMAVEERGRFGFVLSYPAGNPHGYEYEPCNWCFRSTEV